MVVAHAPFGYGLPEDVVDGSTTPLYLHALWLPLVALTGTAVVTFVAVRVWLHQD